MDSWCYQRKKDEGSDPVLKQSVRLAHASRRLAETNTQLGIALTSVLGVSTAAAALPLYVNSR